MLNLAEGESFSVGLLKSAFIACLELNTELSVDKLHRTGKYHHETKIQSLL